MTPGNDTGQRIAVVDSDAGMRVRVSRDLVRGGFVVESFSSGRAFLAEFDGRSASCIVAALRMEGMSGLDLFEQLVRTNVGTPVLFLSGGGDIRSVVRAMKLGAFDVLETPCDPGLVVQRVREAVAYHADVSAREAELRRVRDAMAQLSDVERTVVKHLMKGFTTAEIAAALHRSPRTIENHRARVLRKTGARNAAELIRFAVLDELEGAVDGGGRPNPSLPGKIE